MKKNISDFTLDYRGSGLKKLTQENLIRTTGGGLGQAFVGGFACGWGLAGLTNPITAPVGLIIALVGCSTAFGNW
jgi:hypothetical protein